MLPYVLAAVCAAAASRPAVAVYRLVRMSPAARRHWWPACWHSYRWRWLARNAGLAYLDQHHRRVLRPRVPLTTAVHVQPDARHLMRWPRARFRADEFGFTATVRTVPKVGRAELADAGPWLADAWRCHRVMVTQAKPGRVQVRGMRRDPLAEALPMAACPDVFVLPAPNGAGKPITPRRLYLGRDAWGTDRYAPLANLPAVLVAGLPGYGKSTLILSWLLQLAPSPAVRLGLVLDGKGSADFAPWEPVAPVLGDDLDAAAEALANREADMRARLAELPAALGTRNGWTVGPSPAWPLDLTVIDECHTFLDLEAVKGDRGAEAAVRQCRASVGQLVRKGRSVMSLTVLASQKTTGDSVPTSIRDNIPLALCFATRTREAAVACLGDAIREHPDKCPTGLATPELVGVATALLRSGLDAYTMLRCPDVPEEAAEQVAAHLARPLRSVPPLDAEEIPA